MKGLGIDLCEVKRFERLQENELFLQRVFSADEIAYCKKRTQSAQSFAARFAAKEAEAAKKAAATAPAAKKFASAPRAAADAEPTSCQKITLSVKLGLQIGAEYCSLRYGRNSAWTYI